MDRDLSGRSAAEALAPQPLVVSRDPRCVDAVTRLCAAAALDARVVEGPAAASRWWTRASCVLVGDECANDIASMRLRRRDDVLLVGHAPIAADLWQRAVQIGAADVAILPGDVGRIADRLAETAAPRRRPACVVGVVGAGGGAGASTVAAGLASAYASTGRQRSLLVDADPRSGGIELLMGCEAVPGLRWPDIDVGAGRVAASALLAALPSIDGVSVLSGGSSPVELDAAAVRGMLAAGRRACGLVVVDLPRPFDATSFGSVVSDVDVVVAVVATQVRSVAAGRHVVAAAVGLCSDVRAVVRTTAARHLEPDAVAAALDVPLVGTVPTRRAVVRSADEGTGVDRGRTSRRRYVRLLDALRIPAGSR